MPFERHGYYFDGAFSSATKLEPRAGVYVVWCKFGEQWTCLDIGESQNVQERVLGHDRAQEWAWHCRGNLYYAVHYTPEVQQPGRIKIEQHLRSLEQPICGQR
jgi:hypothetical protein